MSKPFPREQEATKEGEEFGKQVKWLNSFRQMALRESSRFAHRETFYYIPSEGVCQVTGIIGEHASVQYSTRYTGKVA